MNAPDLERSRRPHVVMDADSRVHKARKIIALVGEERFARARNVLEIGCGSGVISATLAQLGGPGLRMHAVDVVDSRSVMHGYDFQRVAGTALPFADGAFDIVISNHVIEHVGPPAAQMAHLLEIHRVLAPAGIGYLAVPNKWRLVEPHFRLPLLSWLPQGAADHFVRLARKGSHYDCLPLSRSRALALFDAAGFTAVDATSDALRATVALEFPASGLMASASGRIPDRWLQRGVQAMPTFVFLLRPRRA